MVRHRLSLLLALLACGVPAVARAENLVFRNECGAPVVVQAVSVFRGRVFRDRPYLLNPGDATPAVAIPGDKIITVYDAKVPNRILFRDAIPGGRADLHFGILPDAVPGRARIELRRPPAPPTPPMPAGR
jgi:hypothetical protein